MCRYGKINEVLKTLEKGLENVHLDNWLGVLPQLIARIDHPEPSARKILHSLLSRLGEKHAQALVYPLSVGLKVQEGTRGYQRVHECVFVSFIRNIFVHIRKYHTTVLVDGYVFVGVFIFSAPIERYDAILYPLPPPSPILPPLLFTPCHSPSLPVIPFLRAVGESDCVELFVAPEWAHDFISLFSLRRFCV